MECAGPDGYGFAYGAPMERSASLAKHEDNITRVSRAAYYRGRAEEARTKADRMSDPDGRLFMLNAAKLWEKMAITDETNAACDKAAAPDTPRPLAAP